MSTCARGHARAGSLVAGGLALLALALGCTDGVGGSGRINPNALASLKSTGLPDATSSAGLDQGAIENTGATGTPDPGSTGADGTSPSPTDDLHASHHPTATPQPTPTPTEEPILTQSYGIEFLNVPAGTTISLYRPPDSAPAHPDYPSTFQLLIKVTTNTGSAMGASWSISPAGIATVSAGNVLRALQAGSATLTARAIDGNSNPESVPITVSASGGVDAEVE